jgi:hypothetical protein
MDLKICFPKDCRQSPSLWRVSQGVRKWLFFLFLFLWNPLHSQLIEFYADWSWNSKGTKLFTPTTDQEDDKTVLWKVQAQLQSF